MTLENVSVPIDHVKLPVGDRERAVEWLRETLGFTINEDYERWSEAGGPLLVTSDGGSSNLALVPGAGGPSDSASPGHIALRIPGDEFLDLIDRLEKKEVRSRSGSTVMRQDILDRKPGFAVIVLDPWGNQFELISYDYETVASQL